MQYRNLVECREIPSINESEKSTPILIRKKYSICIFPSCLSVYETNVIENVVNWKLPLFCCITQDLTAANATNIQKKQISISRNVSTFLAWMYFIIYLVQFTFKKHPVIQTACLLLKTRKNISGFANITWNIQSQEVRCKSKHHSKRHER